MKKENLKVGDLYEVNGEMVMVTRIFNEYVYVASVEFDENGEPRPMLKTENLMTNAEIKHLK